MFCFTSLLQLSSWSFKIIGVFCCRKGDFHAYLIASIEVFYLALISGVKICSAEGHGRTVALQDEMQVFKVAVASIFQHF